MKDIETTWSHNVGRKLGQIRMDRGMTQQELADSVGVAQKTISGLLGRKDKGNDEIFTKIGIALGLPKKEMNDLLHASMYEAIEMEFPEAGLGFALKSRFGLSEKGLRDVLLFIGDVQKKEAKGK